MSCTDPKERERLLEGGDETAAAWQEHLEACEECRRLEGGVRTAAGAFDEEIHPAGSALVAFDEEPDSLDADTRAWIAAHLDQCADCRQALIAIPAEEPAAPPRLFFRPLLAAASVLLCVTLVVIATDPCTWSPPTVGRPGRLPLAVRFAPKCSCRWWKKSWP